MKTPLMFLLGAVLAMSMVLVSGRSVVASPGLPMLTEASGQVPIRALRRLGKDAEASSAAVRDPFVSRPPPAMLNDTPAVAALPAAAPARPAFPAFRILGKQEDDEGWAVFVSSPEKPDMVWVVREGEALGESFRVSKLAPPLLIIKSTRNGQSRTFNIGKDEE